MGYESDTGTLEERVEAARQRHPTAAAPVVLGDDAVRLIGAGLLQRYYGAPYDPSGTFREVPLAAEPLAIDLRDTTRAKGLGPRQLKARWRAFRSYWTGHLLSVTGDHFTLIALPLAADRVSHSALIVGLVVFAETLSTVLLGTAAGTYADRRSPIPTMLTTDSARAVLLLALAMLEWSGSLTSWMVIAMSFVLGALRLLHDGAESAFVAGLVPEELDVKSQARITLSENIGSTIGPLAAGAASSVGLWVAFGVDGITFIAAVAAVGYVARLAHRRDLFLGAAGRSLPDGEDAPTYREDLFATFRIIGGQPKFVAILVVAALFNLLTLPVGAQFISLARDLGLGGVGIGVMFALTGIAGIVTAPLVERGDSIRPGWLVLSTGGIGAAVLIAGLFPSVATVAVAFVVAGAGFAVAFTHYAAMRQRLFPPETQGRVALASRTVLWSTVLLGSVLTGWLAEVRGASAMWVVCGAAGVLTALVGSAAGMLRMRID